MQKHFPWRFTPNWSEKVFVISRTKNTVSWIYVIKMLIKKLLEFISEKELQKRNQKEFRIEKVLTKNRNNLYAKWKGYDNKDIV